jgi:hypothetical protein
MKALSRLPIAAGQRRETHSISPPTAPLSSITLNIRRIIMNDKIKDQTQENKGEQQPENNNGITLTDLSVEEEVAEEAKGGIGLLLPAVQKAL